MIIFILRRFAQAILSMFFITLVIYTYFVYLSPFAVSRHYEGILATGAQVEGAEYNGFPMSGSSTDDPNHNYFDSTQALREIFKVDRPWPFSYLLWLFDPQSTMQLEEDGVRRPKGIRLDIFGLRIEGSGMLTGDFGTSTAFYKPSLGSLLTDKWTNSLLLMSTSLFFALLIALPTGIIGALKQDSALDTTLTFLTFVGLSIPPFMLAFILSSIFGIFPYNLRQQTGWDWFPMILPGYVYTLDQEGSWINRIYHLILPVTTLALAQGALLTRHVRSAMLEIFHQDYIRTALAKGMSVRRVVIKHALRNALLPIITVTSLLLPTLISGSMIVERVFSYPGMGLLFFDAVQGCVGSPSPSVGTSCPPFGGAVQDFTMALGLIVIMVVIVVLSSMLADILYAAADPRINLDKRKT